MTKEFTPSFNLRNRKKMESIALILVTIIIALVGIFNTSNNVVMGVILIIPIFLLYYSVNEISLLLLSKKVPIRINKDKKTIQFPCYFKVFNLDLNDVSYIKCSRKGKVKESSFEPPYFIEFFNKSHKSIAYFVLEIYKNEDRKEIHNLLSEMGIEEKIDKK